MALKKNPKVDLKLKYERVFETSMILSLAFLIIAFKFFPTFEKGDSVVQAPQELVNVEDIVNTKQEAAPPPPPKPPIPIEAPSDEVLEDIEIAETELDVDADVGAPPPPPVEEEEEEAEPVFFVAVEEQPEPIGGISGIQSRIVYPEIAKRAGVQGRVFVKAFVDENGNVVKVELLKGIGAGCDEAAMQAVQETKFKPGKQRGKPVKVQVSIPVLFRLQ
ncbi:MAG: energy transducer TonB [Melioribacteraceae bacterium]|nr:energy transducer TonB [Melioribacteraceae bacterium]MCF8353951.1 energy transducer TonB [Melioribacteraceae bacterium]MCF8393679.1 energy transducer TonB [Melioribacteraceae bacterium]MCF8419579.1 energy transducer TonB [Melioribacteraceae bacterium]